MVISARPYPELIAKSSKSEFFSIDEMTFYPLGREALLSGLIALGLEKGDSVLVPAFMCRSTILPLQAYGFKLVFIDIGSNLELPVDFINITAAKDESIKAILVVHFFGLTQNIDNIFEVCQKYGIKIVEDASHSFMSQLLRDKDSIKGNIEIFSMRKSLPVFDGGALRINDTNIKAIKTYDIQFMTRVADIRYLILRFFERFVAELGINIYGHFINTIKIQLRSKFTHERHKESHGKRRECNNISCEASLQLKKYLSSDEYLLSTQHKITYNFNRLSRALQDLGYRLFTDSVKDNVVPQVCVIYDDNGGLVEYLRSKGIGAGRWPGDELLNEVTSNPSKYPNAVFFDKNLALMPIHQSISEEQINYMIDTLAGWQL
jgi:perosamine synthetase